LSLQAWSISLLRFLSPLHRRHSRSRYFDYAVSISQIPQKVPNGSKQWAGFCQPERESSNKIFI
jgi:hypothetical protein